MLSIPQLLSLSGYGWTVAYAAVNLQCCPVADAAVNLQGFPVTDASDILLPRVQRQ
jgi:hypothetical protein